MHVSIPQSKLAQVIENDSDDEIADVENVAIKNDWSKVNLIFSKFY